MALRQIFNPSDPVQIRDINEMFRELYTTKLPLSGGILTGDLDIGGHGLKNYAAITGSNGNVYDTYPYGFCYSYIDGNNMNQSSGPDFPSYGILESCKYSASRFEQTLSAHTSNKRYYRTYYSGTWQPWTSILDKSNTNTLLWSGSWSSGSITVPDFDKYVLYRIRVYENSTRMLACAGDGFLRGGAIYALGTNAHSLQMYASYSGNVLTMEYCNRFTHVSGSTHASSNNCTVIEIWGLL